MGGEIDGNLRTSEALGDKRSRRPAAGQHCGQRPNSQGKGTRIGALWILGDVAIVLAALMIAVRGWLGQGLFGADSPYRTNLMFHTHPTLLMGCLLWFIFSLILVSKRYHLYGPMQMRNTLHEQRLTIQASVLPACCSRALFTWYGARSSLVVS